MINYMGKTSSKRYDFMDAVDINFSNMFVFNIKGETIILVESNARLTK